MTRILICNSSAIEVEVIRAALPEIYESTTLARHTPGAINLANVDVILLDANFTPAKGIDFLQILKVKTRVPILFIAPQHDPMCVADALRAGAFNYLVKTEGICSLIPLALEDALDRFR